MYVSELQHAPYTPGSFQAVLGDLIRAVGRPAFSETLFRTLRSVTGCDHVTVFKAAGAEAPRTVIVEGTGNPRWLHNSNRKYCREHWKADPIRHIDTHPQTNASFLVLVDASELSNSYRDDCFTSMNLYSRASIYYVAGGRKLQFNLYFNDEKGFDPTICQYLSDTSDLTGAILDRHDESGRRDVHRLEQQDIVNRLRLAAPELPNRELQVCTHIARGLTSEGIALELGISLNTVLTYRKRAYARLNISTQNELLQLLVV